MMIVCASCRLGTRFPTSELYEVRAAYLALRVLPERKLLQMFAVARRRVLALRARRHDGLLRDREAYGRSRPQQARLPQRRSETITSKYERAADEYERDTMASQHAGVRQR
jgi:hypothetical protein